MQLVHETQMCKNMKAISLRLVIQIKEFEKKLRQLLCQVDFVERRMEEFFEAIRRDGKNL